jgi:copper chaperone NosL
MTPLCCNRRRFTLLTLAGAGAAALAACSQPARPAAQAVEVTRDTACSLDGMTLADFPGPKAQIVYEQGAPDFFCDTIELFAVMLKPEQKRAVRAAYVQDMAKADWDAPQGQWIDARHAFYVVGSRRHGSMGETFASFASEADAQVFARQYGGKTYRFAQITPEMAELDGGVLKDKQM